MKNKIVALGRQPKPDMTIKGLADRYLESLRCSGRSDKTLINYRNDLAKFGSFYGGPIDSLTPESLEQFFAGLHAMAPATQKRIRSTASSFLAYCTRREFLARNPLDKLERPSFQRDEASRPKHLNGDQFKAVLRHLGEEARLAAVLSWHGGFRLSEVLSITLPDINAQERFIEITVRGKGNKRATVSLLDTKTIRTLQAHIKKVQKAGGIALFTTPTRTLQWQFAEAVKKAGLVDAASKPLFSWHSLRHGCAVSLLEGGVPIDIISRHLRHSSIAVTQVYARTSNERLVEELGRFYAGR